MLFEFDVHRQYVDANVCVRVCTREGVCVYVTGYDAAYDFLIELFEIHIVAPLFKRIRRTARLLFDSRVVGQTLCARSVHDVDQRVTFSRATRSPS